MGAYLASSLISDLSSKQTNVLSQKVLNYLLVSAHGLPSQTLELLSTQRNESLLTAYLQVLINIIKEVNTQTSTGKNTKVEIIKTCWSMVANSNAIQDIVRQGLKSRDVVYEKAIKLYCQIVILHSKA
jgi:hypothetical protein